MNSEIIKEMMSANGDGIKYLKLCHKCGEKFIVHSPSREHGKSLCGGR